MMFTRFFYLIVVFFFACLSANAQPGGTTCPPITIPNSLSMSDAAVLVGSGSSPLSGGSTQGGASRGSAIGQNVFNAGVATGATTCLVECLNRVSSLLTGDQQSPMSVEEAVELISQYPNLFFPCTRAGLTEPNSDPIMATTPQNAPSPDLNPTSNPTSSDGEESPSCNTAVQRLVRFDAYVVQQPGNPSAGSSPLATVAGPPITCDPENCELKEFLINASLASNSLAAPVGTPWGLPIARSLVVTYRDLSFPDGNITNILNDFFAAITGISWTESEYRCVEKNAY